MTGSAHTRWWRIGEVVLGVPLLAAIALQFLVPVSFPGSQYRMVVLVVGVAVMLGGLMVLSAARRELGRYRQPTDPGHPTSRLVTTGIFGISRNPIYLGAVVFLIGLALVASLTWMLLLLPLAIVACHLLLILPEERYLADTFGTEYARYAGTVGRWMGRSPNRAG
ncbi:MAG: methyltransferase family protein [Gemmatimonadales bacterium]